MQLVAYGAQDVYLTGNPQITFFKVVYRRHTNFAVENIEQFFSGSLDFGHKSSCEISRSGDLITQIFLKVILPEIVFNGEFAQYGHVEFGWCRRIGHMIIEEVELEIGGSQIDKQYGNWLNIWWELTHEVGQIYGYSKMIGDVPELTKVTTLSWDCPDNNVLKPSYALYIPLQFYFNRNNGLALPLIALQYHVVKIYVRFRHLDQLIITSEAFRSDRQRINLDDVTLWVNYVYLDTEERRRFAQVSHEYLIEQVQFTGEEAINTANTVKYKLNFNHPCKAIYWVTRMANYEGAAFMIYSDFDWEVARHDLAKLLLLSEYDLDEFGYFNLVPEGVQCGQTYTSEAGINYIAIDPSCTDNGCYVFGDCGTAAKYSQGSGCCLLIGKLAPGEVLMSIPGGEDLQCKVSGTIQIVTDFTNEGYVYPDVWRIGQNDLTIWDMSVPVQSYCTDNRTPYIKAFDVNVWMLHNYGLLINGKINPVSEYQLQLNGQDRETRRSGFWADTIRPYEHFTDTPCDGLNVFSFALNPEEHQPSGTCNFSRIDTAQLNLWFNYFVANKYCAIFSNPDNKIYVYADNYNVLRIMSGMGGLAFSN